MKLKLNNPIIFFDIESTGLSITSDRIVEISYIKLMPNGCEESKTLRINPEMHIPETSTEIHGICDEDVADCPKFKEVAAELARTFEGCDIAGFNSNRFDVPMLVEEFLRAGVDIDLSRRKFVDVQNIYHKLEQRTLTAAYKHYCGKDLENAHTAMADTRATLEVLEAQLDRYPDALENDVEFLSEFSCQRRTADFAGRIGYDAQGNEIFTFGKHNGKKVTDVLKQEPGFYGWMLGGDFARNTKQVLTRIYMNMKKK